MPSEHTPRCLLSSYDAVQHGFRNYSPHFQSYKNSRSAGPPDFCHKTVILPLVQQKGICGSPDNQAIPKRLDAGPQPHRHRNACSIGKDGRTSTAGWGLGALTGGFAPCGRTSTAGWGQGTLTGDLLPAVAHPHPPGGGLCRRGKKKKGCASELTHPFFFFPLLR